MIVENFEYFLRRSVNFQLLSPLLVIYFQSLCNMIVNNKATQIIVWNKVITSIQCQVLIEISKENMKLYNCITMIIYNCIIHNDKCLMELLSISNKSIISSLLINSINEESENNNDFIFLIMNFILSKNKTAKMMIELMFSKSNRSNEDDGGELEIIINREQLIFLEIYRSLIEDEEKNDFKPEEYEDDVVIERLFNILNILCNYLCNNNPKGIYICLLKNRKYCNRNELYSLFHSHRIIMFHHFILFKSL